MGVVNFRPIAGLLMLLLAVTAAAQERNSRFFDAEDGQFDLSYFLENPRGFLPIPIIAKEALNGLEPRDVDRGYRWEQGFTLEMYMHEDSQKSRDAFVDTGKAAKF